MRPELIDFLLRLFRISLQRGMTLNSWWRDPQVNLAVGGVFNSFHLWALALDIGAPDHARLIDEARAAGLEAIDEGTHVHVEPVGRPPDPSTLSS
ncbi:MAG: D-Ala-D-Ala carboxypeptidase family metallohydrolase [Myxococcota bacterium]